MATFKSNDLDRKGLLRRHRLAIADCIMAWATCESIFRAMLTAIEKRPLDAGAESYNRLDLSQGWVKLKQALRDQGATPEVLAVIKRHKKDFALYVEARNLIAHAGCVGTLRSDPDYLVFAPFELNAPGEMLVVCQPLQAVARSTRWARSVAELCNRILEDLGH